MNTATLPNGDNVPIVEFRTHVPIEVQGVVRLMYPRRWWQLRRSGWHAHVDGLGQRCWIQFTWPPS